MHVWLSTQRKGENQPQMSAIYDVHTEGEGSGSGGRGEGIKPHVDVHTEN